MELDWTLTTYTVTCPEWNFEYEIHDSEGVLDFQEQHRVALGYHYILGYELTHP